MDVELTRESALRVHAEACDAFAALVRTMPIDAAPVPNSSWSTNEVAAHVLSMLRALRTAANGEGGWRSLHDPAGENERLLAATRERRPGELAHALVEAAAALRATWASHPGDVVGWHGGVKAPLEAVAGVSAADVLLHGWDIARALERRWTITPEAATIAAGSGLILAPHFVSEHARHVDVTYAIRFRTGPSFTATFARGTLTVTPGRPERADCTITADPVAFLLVGAGRAGRWRAALTGRVRAGGRRPWLGLQFTSLVSFP